MEEEEPASTPQRGPCCFLFARGTCRFPDTCKFRHDIPDDGKIPCGFGATCRLGHANRVLSSDPQEQIDYWTKFRADGAFVGDNPSLRDATLLRSQLEPHSTPALRQRLIADFGHKEEELEGLGRATIMQMLLKDYEGIERKIVKVEGTLVREELTDLLLSELKTWAENHLRNRQERPSISAEAYMILRSPAEFSKKDSKKAKSAAAKISQHARLWELAAQAIGEVDPEYAAAFTALAVTMGFKGSPHIDKQNTGPFYGIALGDFPEGQGCICVECDAFTVAQMNTKNRLGKVDGRYPHWVGPYESGQRYSLIYYQTEGSHIPPTVAYYEPKSKPSQKEEHHQQEEEIS